MYILDGKRLAPNKAFTDSEGRQYPRNWLKLTTIEEKQAIGIEIQPDPVVAVYDQRFYWSPELPKDLDQLKETWTAKVKEIAGSLLAPTDWYIVRQAENSTSIPAAVLARRGEIRTFSGEKEAAIAACADVPALAEYLTGSDFSRWEALPEPEPEAPAEEVVAEEPVAEAPVAADDNVATDSGITSSTVSGGSSEDTIIL